MKEIKIEVNGDTKLLTPSDLNSLLRNLKINDTAGLALAINSEVIPKSEWDKHQIKDGDKILLVSATQGG